MSKSNRPSSSSRPQRQETPRKKSAGGMLLGLFLGLVIGVLIAFGVVLYLNKTPIPFMNKSPGAPRPVAPPTGTAPAPAPVPLALPGKPGDKVGDKPRFDFYGILEGKQSDGVSAPTSVPPAQTSVKTDTSVPKPVAKSGETYYLQAGAFQKEADADNLKAKMAMMGVVASVQEADVPEKGKLLRVRVGPIATPEEMNRVRTQLSQGGIQATVVKQKTE